MWNSGCQLTSLAKSVRHKGFISMTKALQSCTSKARYSTFMKLNLLLKYITLMKYHGNTNVLKSTQAQPCNHSEAIPNPDCTLAFLLTLPGGYKSPKVTPGYDPWRKNKSEKKKRTN